MGDIWMRVKLFGYEAAQKSQSITTYKLVDIVAETARKSKDLAIEASKKADLIKVTALKPADLIQSKSFSDIIHFRFSPTTASNSTSSKASNVSDWNIRTFGITEELKNFVKGLTLGTFLNFPRKFDEDEASDVPKTPSNVQKDLSEWQECHATIILRTVKEISILRYELCPRMMKERMFWLIYFILVSSHVAQSEKQYIEEKQKKSIELFKYNEAASSAAIEDNFISDAMKKRLEVKSKLSSSLLAKEDLDTFLLGDLKDSHVDAGYR